MKIKKISKKGLTLVEILAGVIFLTLSIIALINLVEYNARFYQLLINRVEATELAVQTANIFKENFTDEIIGVGNLPTELTIGAHNITTDAAICTVPATNILSELSGAINYEVKAQALPTATTGVLLINITILWTDPNTNEDQQETLSVLSCAYTP